MTTDQIKSGGELLPCPFCGGEAKRIFRLGRTPFIECQKCGIEQSGHTHAEAVAAWNSRTAIGMEAGTGETEGLDPKGDSPGPKGIAVNTGHSTPGDAEVREAGDLKHKLWMIISHATGGELSNEADVDRSTNDICVRISAFRSKLYQAGKDAVASSLATPSGRAQGDSRPFAWFYRGPAGEQLPTMEERRDLVIKGWTETPLYAAPPAQDQTK